MKVLMAAPVMARGFGLPEVIAALAPELERLGVGCEVACLSSDGLFDQLPVHEVEPTPEAVLALANRIGADVVVAHGSPFFEVLPALRGKVRTVAYEHGEPPAVLFDDAAERARREKYKVDHVYAHVDDVVAISEFIRSEIGWPDATVIPNGVDHIRDLGTKEWLPPRPPDAPLRVGLLMRLGEGEARYKGNDMLEYLRRLATERHGLVDARWEVMGRGSDTDAARVAAAGFRCHLNATNAEREEYLRGLDVFVTLSKWEGCNLPLVEAQALGTASLALDTGAHPEFAPLCFSSLDLMAAQLRAYADDPLLLRAHGDLCYRYVRGQMSWPDSAAALVRLLGAEPAAGRRRWRRRGGDSAVRRRLTNARDLYQAEGAGAVARVALGKVRPKPADSE
ncbi:MAG: glycosyltransferase family 4 protein [Actinobacteria bacterium]|nr:glycosyltransferase family 4 protein [Actinomycetota bacterium]